MTNVRSVKCAIVAVLLMRILFASAETTFTANAECVGYYSLNLPGGIDYPGVPMDFYSPEGRGYRFNDQLGTSPIHINIDSAGGSGDMKSPWMQVSSVVKQIDLLNKVHDLNNLQLTSKADLEVLAKDAEVDNRLAQHERLAREAAVFPFYHLYRNDMAYAIVEGESLRFTVLLGERAVITRRKSLASPEETIDNFLKFYRPRAPFEVPSGPGACTPYGFMTGEKSPAHIAVAIRLLDTPDIVVYLDMLDASEDGEVDHRTVFNRMTYPNSGLLYDIVESRPANRLKPFFEVGMDGRIADATIALVTRASGSESHHVNNPATNNMDWAYLAYLPGKRGGKPGDSFSLRFVVERFSKYAKKPMTEREFRELASAIGASVKRRPGAWTTRD